VETLIEVVCLDAGLSYLASAVTLKTLLHFEVLVAVSDMPDVCTGPSGITLRAVVMATAPFSERSKLKDQFLSVLQA
jgi:hypothetical protein